jgi:hypothetical protein
MLHYIISFEDEQGKMLDFERVKKSAYKTTKGIEKAVRAYRQKAIESGYTNVYAGTINATQCTIHLTEYECTPDKIFHSFAF